MIKIVAQYISVILGCFYCLFILWNRLLRERNPINLIHEYNLTLLSLYILLFILCFCISIFSFREILKITPKYKFLNKLLKISFVENLLNFVRYYILKAPTNFYEFLYQYITIKPFIEKICNYIGYLSLEKYVLMFIIIKNFFYFSVATIFIYEIYYYEKFSTFYKLLPFLIVPLGFEFILFSIKNMGNKNTGIIETWLNITPTQDRTNYQAHLNIMNKDNPWLHLQKDSLITTIKHNLALWIDYKYGIMFVEIYEKKDKKIKPYINLYIYSAYTLGWAYILFQIFINIYINKG